MATVLRGLSYLVNGRSHLSLARLMYSVITPLSRKVL